MDSLDLYIYVIIFGILGLCAYIYFYSEEFQLKCIVSTVDGINIVYVKERRSKKQPICWQRSMTNVKNWFDYTSNKYSSKECVKRLVNGYNPKKIMETLPTSEYTAYSV